MSSDDYLVVNGEVKSRDQLSRKALIREEAKYISSTSDVIQMSDDAPSNSRLSELWLEACRRNDLLGPDEISTGIIIPDQGIHYAYIGDLRNNDLHAYAEVNDNNVYVQSVNPKEDDLTSRLMGDIGRKWANLVMESLENTKYEDVLEIME